MTYLASRPRDFSLDQSGLRQAMRGLILGLVLTSAGCKGREPGQIQGLSAAPMDLVSDSLDANGFRLNPKWNIQVLTTKPPKDTVCGGFERRGFPGSPGRPDFGKPPCVTDPSLVTSDTRFRTCQLRAPNDVSFHGHINWFVVAYTGILRLEKASEDPSNPLGKLGDKDLNLGLGRVDSAGIMERNEQGYLHLEMDRRETAGQWKSPWWSSFGRMILPNRPNAGKMVNRRTVTALGLMGLDGVHHYVAELHPVYALAVSREERDATTSGEAWEVFARNSAKNEGYCSRNEYPLTALASDTIKLDIPWKTEATGVSVDSASFENRAKGTRFLGIQVGPRRLALILELPRSTQNLPHAEERAMIDGEIFLHWSGLPARPFDSTQIKQLKAVLDRADSTQGVDSIEYDIERLIGELSDSARQELNRNLAQVDKNFLELNGPPKEVHLEHQHLGPGETRVITASWPTTPRIAWQRGPRPVNARADSEDSVIFDALCKANRIPASRRSLCPAK